VLRAFYCKVLEPSFDLLPGGREAQRPAIDVLHAIQDEVCLILVQLSQFYRNDPALPVGEHGEREDQLHAEGMHRIKARLLADEDGVVDAGIARVSGDGGAKVDRDADYRKASAGAFVVQAYKKRNLPPARFTPGRPEIDDDGMPGPVGEPVRDAGEVGERKVRQHHGNDAAWRRRLGLRRSRSDSGGLQGHMRPQQMMHRDAGKRSERDQGDTQGNPQA